MDALLEMGIPLILWFQSLGEWLATPMAFFSFLGAEEFFLMILPALYWCISTELGLRVGVILLVNGSLNAAFKLFFHAPRPYWVSTEVQALASETSFGVPSGHAQVAAGVWGMLASQLKQRWAWPAALFIIFMIGISRLHLGVHFPLDVLVGWLIGGLILWLVLRYWDAAAAQAASRSLAGQVGLAFAASMALILVGAVAYLLLQNWPLPQAWLDQAASAGVDELPEPVTMSGVITSAATLFGFWAGLAWMNANGGFSIEGTAWQKLGRYFLGVVGVLVLWYGLGEIFPRGEEIVSYSLRFLRYALIGAWVSAGAPYVFIKLRLAGSN